ncbi:DNA cross-link repair protein SNM1 [Magnolia sinica]|uniref:DNA cross-link repair protein SNM1 n=1 Tax=Magnolia sinica TaxID=86752 RepID=UPI00265AC0F2|nr:DNA cross-link repair protein SNM1 [Magnolia sinica]
MEILTDEREGDISISENLDENGFPFLPLSPESESRYEETDGSILAVDGSFVSDFYGSGTDWSCLREGESDQKKLELERGTDWSCLKEGESDRKKLVQRDLFQMWGFKKRGGPSECRVSSPPAMKREKRRINGHDSISDWAGRKVPRLGKEKTAEHCVGARRACPFYKKIPGTPFTVDAFCYGLIEGCEAYFLSHFHHDHYGGLSKRWSHGPIYCTPLTARLVKMCLSVNPLFIHPLELDTEYVVEGIKVTMLEANHCPGAALIHFRLGDGRCYLHTGDFRACKLMQSHPILLSHRVNVLYLDTTYCNPKYRFPSKEDVVGFVARITKSTLAKQPKTLVVVGAYSIGKEHVYIAISKALGVNIYTDASRRRILQSFGWPELSGKICSLGQSTPLHVLPISSLRPESLQQYLKKYGEQFTAVLAFRPTGWSYSEAIGNQLDLIRPSSKGNVKIYGVPYSEHSSFLELRDFVQFLKPDKIIPTVNVGNAANRDKMQSHFREWLKT